MNDKSIVLNIKRPEGVYCANEALTADRHTMSALKSIVIGSVSDKAVRQPTDPSTQSNK